MVIQRIFAASIAALLLSVSPLAAACDLSCAFAAMNSDCHIQKGETQDSATGGMRMDGMSMDGMTMSEMSHRQDQQEDFASSGAMANHPSISGMGPCEKRSCDSATGVSAKANRPFAPQLDPVFAAHENPRADGASPIFHDAWVDIAVHPFGYESPLHLSLRI
jgi:hypothetical protein